MTAQDRDDGEPLAGSRAPRGEIAGRIYGVDPIPADWCESLALRHTFERLADGLLALAEAM